MLTNCFFFVLVGETKRTEIDMANEKDTEYSVIKLLEAKGYQATGDKKKISFQGSDDKHVQGLLKSKSGNKTGKGKPEFTVKLNGIASDLLIIECKKDPKLHSSTFACKDTFNANDLATIASTAETYAVDGVLHYMASVMGHYNVIGLAISGVDEKTWSFSTFMSTPNGSIVRLKHTTVQTANEYIQLLRSTEYKVNEDIVIANIQKELPILHNELRDKMKLAESEKPLLISACLLALQDTAFKDSFKSKSTSAGLASFTYESVKDRLLNGLNVPEKKVNTMMSNFAFIKTNQNVIAHIKYILEKVLFLFDSYEFSETSYDIIGNFYNEFLKYTGGDKQGLGIVLTPKHITDLFCQLGEINANSVVLDTCTGTGAFLISAMKYMIDMANGDKTKIDRIKEKQLIGIEQNTQMFTLACSNMILRHDGKSNMFNGSCFDPVIHAQIKELKPNVCLINPPYSQKDNNESELSFIFNALNLLEQNGKLVAIVPISSAIEMSNSKIEQRRNILKHHTLDAVFSMPDELFYPVGTNTCIMVFTAGKPHGTLSTYKQNNKDVEAIKPTKPTYFGYWKDDGFVKTKTLGRCDKNGAFAAIQNDWIRDYKLGNTINGKSAKAFVSERDEWCCEAYMSVDYNNITSSDFENEIRKYLAFQIINSKLLLKKEPT